MNERKKKKKVNGTIQQQYDWFIALNMAEEKYQQQQQKFAHKLTWTLNNNRAEP